MIRTAQGMIKNSYLCALILQYANAQDWLATLGRLYAGKSNDAMEGPYHLNLDSTLVAASGQPQMNKAAAKASAHDSLHGLPARSASFSKCCSLLMWVHGGTPKMYASLFVFICAVAAVMQETHGNA